MKNVLKDLLAKFVAEQLVKGENVPPEVFLALQFPNTAEWKKDDINEDSSTGNDFQDFVDNFNEYIISKSNSCSTVGFCDAKRCLTEEVERCISLANKVESACRVREEQSLSLLSVIRQLRQLKKQYKESLKFNVSGEGVVISEYGIRVEQVVLKCFKKSCTCHPFLLKALERLNKLVISEHSKWDMLLREKKITLARYKEMEDCREYLHLLSEYIKLLDRQKALEMNAT